MKIVILDGYTENPGDLSWEWLNKYGEVKVYDRTPADLTLERIGDADIVYTNKVELTKEILIKSKNLKFIGVLAAGYNIVDIVAAKELGIKVTNTPGYGSSGVAQMVFAHILEVCNNVYLHNESVRKNEWANNKDWCYWLKPVIGLNNKTLGIIGFGNIGREVGKIGKAFGMDVIVYDKNKVKEAENVELDELLKRADVISLHCPLFPETKEIIRKENIDKMKDGVILVNTSRGSLINEKDLYEALKSGKIYGAGLDVLVEEPPKENILLSSLDNVYITPHIAWAARESRDNIMKISEKNLEAYFNGKNLNVVNL